MEETKTCSQCSKTKPLSEFSKRASSKDGHTSYCKACAREYSRHYRAENREREKARHLQYYAGHKEQDRDWHLQNLYGVTLADYNAMLESQDGKCAICGKTPEEAGERLHVDHDHKTGKVRELLCGKCNRMISQHDDNPALLRSAADYVEKHRQ